MIRFIDIIINVPQYSQLQQYEPFVCQSANCFTLKSTGSDVNVGHDPIITFELMSYCTFRKSKTKLVM